MGYPTEVGYPTSYEKAFNGDSCLCVVDTGASISLIGKSQWDILNKDSSCEMLPSDIVAEAANNSLIGIVGKTVLSICVNGRQMSEQTFYVKARLLYAIYIKQEI